VAVVVDGYYKGNSKVEGENFTPRTEEELKRLQDIVSNAVGFDPQRRDSVTVSSLPFRTMELAADESTDPAPNVQKELMQQGIKNGLIALVTLLFFFLVLRPFLKWATIGDVEKELKLFPKTVAELESSRRDQNILSLTKAANLLEEGEPLEKKEEFELRKRIVEKLDTTPRKGFRIIQDWMDEDIVPQVPQMAEG
jgi:flagellar M-ring protein FliF